MQLEVCGSYEIISSNSDNPNTKAQIIKIDHKETNSRGYRISIHPSGRKLHFPFDTITEEEEEYLEPESEKGIVPQKPEEIQELLPEFNDSSALSLLEVKETWEPEPEPWWSQV